MKKYEFLPHTADLKIRVYGQNFKEIIENSLLALNDYLGARLTKEKIEKEIKVQNESETDLLIDFLSEVLAEIYIEKAIFTEFKEEILTKTEIKGKIIGFKFRNLTKDIKAITYHQVKLEKKKNNLIFEFIVDI